MAMITVSKQVRDMNRMCGLSGKYRAMSYVISYLEGTMLESEYAEFYDYASDLEKNEMDILLLEYLMNTKRSA